MLSQSVIDELSKSLTASSVKRYISWSNIISPNKYDVNNFVNWYKSITEETKERKDYSSLLSVIMKVLSIEGKPIDIYQNLMTEHKQNNMNIISKPSATDLKNQITVDNIKKILEELENKTKRTKREDYGIQFITMLLEIAPFRTEDYVSVSFTADTHNYLDIPTKRLIYTQGKSINSNRIIDIPDSLFKIIIDNKNKYNANFLFPSFRMTKQSMTNKGFVSFSKRVFNADISPQILRQIFVSHYDRIKMSKKDRLIKSRYMGHSLATSQTKYTKFSSTEADDKDKIIAELRDTIRQLKEQLK